MDFQEIGIRYVEVLSLRVVGDVLPNAFVIGSRRLETVRAV